MRARVVAAILMLLTEPANAADTYLCIPDLSTGFAFDAKSQKWNPTHFSVSGKKYLLKRVAGGAEWSDFGSPYAPAPCTNFDAGGFTVCKSETSEGAFNVRFSTINFNERSLRYELAVWGGYMYGGLPSWGNPIVDPFLKDNHDTPVIEIGTCSGL